MEDFHRPSFLIGRQDCLPLQGCVTTTYVLDLAAGLTQILSDGTETYLYGLGRVGKYNGSDWTYYLSDALGSVRQLTDPNA